MSRYARRTTQALVNLARCLDALDRRLPLDLETELMARGINPQNIRR